MNNIIIYGLYWFVSTLQLLLLKIITHIYKIDDFIFNSFCKVIMLPYYIYKLFILNKNSVETINAKWFDIVNGILDQMDTVLTYIAYYGLSIGEYITFRTLSVVIGSILLMINDKKFLPIQKIISVIIILVACVALFIVSIKSSFFYSFVCITSSIFYAFSSFMLQMNVKTQKELELNFFWTKTISCIIALFLSISNQYLYNEITNVLKIFSVKNIIFILSLEIIITILDNLYYYFKMLCILKSNDGSLLIHFLDITRRFSLIILGILLFSEQYTKIIYLSISIMFLGSIVGLIKYENFLYHYHKYSKKNERIIIELPDIVLV